ALVEASTYPATLDPTIGPEFGMDTPVLTPPLNAQSSPAVAFDGTYYMVVWQDYRSGTSYDVYGARVNTSGAVQDATGIAIATGAGDQSAPDIAFDSSMGDRFLVVWGAGLSGLF